MPLSERLCRSALIKPKSFSPLPRISPADRRGPLPRRPRTMRTPHDQLAKDLLENTLAPGGRLHRQHEVSGEVQAVDVWFLPHSDPSLADALTTRGLLGRMAGRPTLFEPFHKPPDVEALRDCIHKQLAVHRRRRREARTAGPQPVPSPPFPRLWIISAGEPETVIRAYGFKGMNDWPPGFWQREEADVLGLIVIPELPRERDTLILRLMGAGRVFDDALADLNRLSSDAWEWQAAMPTVVVHHRNETENATEEAKEFTMSTQSTYENWLNHQRNEGRAAGIQHAIRAVYESRLGPLPPPLATILDATADIARLDAWLSRVGTCSAEDFAAALESAARTAQPTH